MIKSKNLNLIKDFILSNNEQATNQKLLIFYLDEYLSNGDLENACGIFDSINILPESDYISKFKIYCLIHNEKKEIAQIQFDLVKEEISKFKDANIVAVSKTFPIGHILPLINHGHQHFGENKVQEAQEKWTSLKNDFPNLKLHLIGKLQTNKVKFALPLFDYIHSLDSIKLAEKISLEQEKKNF